MPGKQVATIVTILRSLLMSTVELLLRVSGFGFRV